MKEKTKGIIAFGCLSALSLGLLFGVVTNQPSLKGVAFEAKADQFAVDFSNETITRRIWIVNQNNWSGWHKEFFVHAWNPSDKTLEDDSLVATEAYGTYYEGLYFADVTFKGAGNAINVIVRGGDGNGNVLGWANYNQTITLSLPALNSVSGDVIWLDSAANVHNADENREDRGIASSSIKTAGLGSAELAAVLEQYGSCSSSYASGYNAYPQLKKDILDASTVDGTTEVKNQTYDSKPFATTIDSKVAELKKQYDTKGWYVA